MSKKEKDNLPEEEIAEETKTEEEITKQNDECECVSVRLRVVHKAA